MFAGLSGISSTAWKPKNDKEYTSCLWSGKGGSYSVLFDSKQGFIYSGGKDGKVKTYARFSDFRNEVLDLRILNAKNIKEELGKLVMEASANNLLSYSVGNGITLLHFLIKHKMTELLEAFLYKVPYHDATYHYSKNRHPLVSAFHSHDVQLMTILGKHLKNKKLLLFNNDHFWLYVNSPNKDIRDSVLGSLFNNSEVKSKDDINETDFVDADKLPLTEKMSEYFLTKESFDKLRSASSSSQSLPISVYRTTINSDWGLNDRFVHKYLKIMSQNPEKIMDNPSRYLIFYLWQRYSWLAKSISAVYVIFAASTATELVWCLEKESCA